MTANININRNNDNNDNNDNKGKRESEGMRELLRSFESIYRQRTEKNDKQYTDTLYTLARSIAYSVTNKLINVSCNETLIKARQGISKDKSLLSRLDNTSNNSYTLSYDQDGDITRQVIDTDLKNAYNTISMDNLTDGSDLVHEAILAILEEISKIEDISNEFLEEKYEKRKLRKKVYIDEKDAEKEWETTQTTPIQEAYKHERRYIRDTGSVKVDINEYCYLDMYVTDQDSNTTEHAYKRYPAMYDIGSYAVGIDGKPTIYTADKETAEKTDLLIKKLDLTVRQRQVLSYRLKKYSIRSIATHLGISANAVQKTINLIRKKAIAIGLDPCANK